MNTDQAADLIRQNKAPFIRVMDSSRRLLYCIEAADENNPTANAGEIDYAVDQLKMALPYFDAYGSVVINAATPAIKRANYKNCFTYTVALKQTTGQTPVAPAQRSPMADMVEMLRMFQMFQAMSGNNNNNANNPLAVEVEKLKLQMAHREELLKYQNNDPMKWASLFGPTAMRMAGMKPDEIKETIQMTAMSYGLAQGNPMQQPQRMSGVNEQAAPAQNLNTTFRTFEQLQQMPNEQKNIEIANLFQIVGQKVSAEHFIMLMEIIAAKPDLVPRAIQLHQQGMI